MDNLTGHVIKSYELQELIGKGGFGAVYRAHQQHVGREAAIKIILPEYANQPDFIRRFETEAQLIARLEHPHIVPLYDYWREPGGAYLVMRLLKGGSIHDSLQEHGPWEPYAVSRVLRQIAEALAVAHRQNIIHRDLKPENILFDENGNSYLTDFGIAKDLGGSITQATQNNVIVGSPAYLSPEQIRGLPVTPQSDIYALGIVLYEMLTNERPFPTGSPATLMYKHLSEPLPDISEMKPHLTPALNSVLQRATAKDPDVRYPDTIELANEFRRAIRDQLHDDDGIGTAVISTGSIAMPEPENPYKGLRAFQQADAADFFGREALIQTVLSRLSDAGNTGRFLAVVGPSGSGKSSVIKAGVIPRLRSGALSGSEDWFPVEMVPGIDPMEELEATLLRIAVNPPESLLKQLNEDSRGMIRAIKRVLPDDDTELVLVIDQFEELFTLVDEEEMRGHFMDSLMEAISDPHSRVRVIITLRADFYDRPLNYNRFGELMRQRTEVVLPLSAEELEQAITGPAQRAGLHLEPGLVTAIVADVNEQPGALPLLQYALTELFERRNNFTLTLDAYREIGGTMGALARRADELYAGLDDDSQEAAKQLFLRLVTLGEGTEDTRRRVLQSELFTVGDDRETMELIIDAFGRYRLLTFDHDPVTRSATVEVAHEALIRQWGRLRDWLASSREDLRTQRRLTAAAEEWTHSGKESSFLSRGARLEQLEQWLGTSGLRVNKAEAEYIQTSIALREENLARERARLAHEERLEKRSRDRLRALVVVMGVATVVAVILMIVAFSERRQAEDARADAESNAEAALVARAEAVHNAEEAQSLALGANARNEANRHNPTLALALAIEASKTFEPAPVEVRRVLASTAYGPGIVQRIQNHDAAVVSAVFHPDDLHSVSATITGTVVYTNLETHKTLWERTVTETGLTCVDFSPTGEFIAAAGIDGIIYLLNPETGDTVAEFPGHTDVVTSIVFMPDGNRLVSGSQDKTVRIWDVESGDILQTFTGHEGVVFDVAISANGQYIASSSGDETIEDDAEDETERDVRLWDVESGEQIARFVPNSGFVRAVAISPDGNYLAAGTWDSGNGGVVHLWNIRTQELERQIFGHADVISDVAFSQDGKQIYSTAWNQVLEIWDRATGLELDQFATFDERPLHIDVSNDGEHLLVATGNFGNNTFDPANENSTDTSVWLIDLRSRALLKTIRGHNDWIWSADISPDGSIAATGSGPLRPPVTDSSIRIWDTSTGEELRKLDGHTETVEGLDFNADASLLLSGAWDGRIILWDAASGDQIRQFGDGETSVETSVLNVQFSPDEQTAASGQGDGTAIIWDIKTGAILQTLAGHTNAVAGIAFSPDGTKLATSSWDNTAAIWDLNTGEMLHHLEGHTGWVNDIAFSPDGTTILTASWDSTVRQWDVETGKELRQFLGHNGTIQTVTFSPNGQLALSGGGDTDIRLWDLASGQELFRYEGHTDWISQVHFVEDGTRAVTSGQDKTLRIWQIPSTPEEIIAWAKVNRYVRELTCQERQQFRIQETCATPDI